MTTLKHHIATLILMFLVMISFGQKANGNYLLAFRNSSSGPELWGFKTTSGQIKIKPKYRHVLGTDNLFDMAFVMTLDSKWIAINKHDSVILVPYFFDNGPDYLEDGLFRFVENNRIGFANSKGQKIIPAQFDFASPFSEGLAAFNIGGKMEKWDQEHSTWNGGLWGFVNKRGQIVIKPQFANAYNFNEATCEVWTKDNKHILIDKKGRTIKVFEK
jgi:hypothetical protein